MFFMASYVELNDRLILTKVQGFPSELDLKKHRENPLKAEDFSGRTFGFYGKSGKRFYIHSPGTCLLIQDLERQLLYWGEIAILEQTKSGKSEKIQRTSGEFEIIDIYDPICQEAITRHESPRGKSYFSEDKPIYFKPELLDLFLERLRRKPDPHFRDEMLKMASVQEMLKRAGYTLPSEEDLKA